MCLNALVNVPFGPLTVTTRDLNDTVTLILIMNYNNEL